MNSKNLTDLEPNYLGITLNILFNNNYLISINHFLTYYSLDYQTTFHIVWVDHEIHQAKEWHWIPLGYYSSDFLKFYNLRTLHFHNCIWYCFVLELRSSQNCYKEETWYLGKWESSCSCHSQALSLYRFETRSTDTWHGIAMSWGQKGNIK